MVRTLGALAAGLAVAILLIIAVEGIGNRLFPPPAGYDLTQGSAINLPVETLVWPVIGWFLGALAGAWLALRLSGQRWAGWAVAGCVLAAAVLNFALIAHPLWMMAAGVAAPLVGAGIAQLLPRRL